jgi:hypothetical protein
LRGQLAPAAIAMGAALLVLLVPSASVKVVLLALIAVALVVTVASR